MSEPAVLVSHQVPAAEAAELRAEIEDRVDAAVRVAATPPETRVQVETAEILLTTSVPAELLDAAEELRWVQALSAGVDGYDLDALAAADVALTNASGVHAQPVAEQVLGYLLAFERGIHRGMRQQHRGVWESYGAGELRDATVGIVGLGAIGGRVAELCAALGTEVVGTKRTPETAPDAVDEAFGTDGLYEVLRRSDYVVLACPLTDETEGLIGADELATMPSSAVLVNVARGGVVDQSALVSALQRGRLGGAALDVFEEEPLDADSPLWDLSNVVVTPHMAGLTPHYRERCAELFAENYRRYVDGDLDEFVNRIV